MGPGIALETAETACHTTGCEKAEEQYLNVNTTVCDCSLHFLSPPLRIQLQLVVCNVCHTQTPFSQTTTAALSVGRPCNYTYVRNKHQCCYLSISHCYLYSGMRKKCRALISEQPRNIIKELRGCKQYSELPYVSFWLFIVRALSFLKLLLISCLQ
jgi:hypothetical protein